MLLIFFLMTAATTVYERTHWCSLLGKNYISEAFKVFICFGPKILVLGIYCEGCSLSMKS